jgi:hypothetical protein
MEHDSLASRTAARQISQSSGSGSGSSIGGRRTRQNLRVHGMKIPTAVDGQPSRRLFDAAPSAPFTDFNIRTYDCSESNTNGGWCTLSFDSSSDTFPTTSTAVNRIVVDSLRTQRLISSVSGGTFMSWDGTLGTEFTSFHDAPDCANAYWAGANGGAYTLFCTNVDTDDVIAHEWIHAYTEKTSDLMYEFEPGALNEALSDVFGHSVDILNHGLYGDADGNTENQKRLPTQTCSSGYGGSDPSQRWLVGWGSSLGVIRDMYYPECENHPSSVKSSSMYCGTGDYGGVHLNSGILNRLYVVLTDGGYVPVDPADSSQGTTYLNGLGMNKTLGLFWGLQQRLYFVSSFYHAGEALVDECQLLIGSHFYVVDIADGTSAPSGDPLTSEDCEQLSKAVIASGLLLKRGKDFCYHSATNSQDLNALCDIIDDAKFNTNGVTLDGWATSCTGSSPNRVPTGSDPCQSGTWFGIYCSYWDYDSPKSYIATVDLSFRNLGGEIPGALGSMPYVQRVIFDDCGLSGTIPSAVSSLQYLNELSVVDNPELSGTFPSFSSAQTTVARISVSRTGISGSLPAPDFLLRPYLRSLDLESTLMTGTVGSAFCDHRINQLKIANSLFSCFATCLLTDDVENGLVLSYGDILDCDGTLTRHPSPAPSGAPSGSPSGQPSSSLPSALPSGTPSSCVPSSQPSSSLPSAWPSGAPTALPSSLPSALPSSTPSEQPSSSRPSPRPSGGPSAQPSASPTAQPILEFAVYTALTGISKIQFDLVPANGAAFLATSCSSMGLLATQCFDLTTSEVAARRLSHVSHVSHESHESHESHPPSLGHSPGSTRSLQSSKLELSFKVRIEGPTQESQAAYNATTAALVASVEDKSFGVKLREEIALQGGSGELLAAVETMEPPSIGAPEVILGGQPSPSPTYRPTLVSPDASGSGSGGILIYAAIGAVVGALLLFGGIFLVCHQKIKNPVLPDPSKMMGGEPTSGLSLRPTKKYSAENSLTEDGSQSIRQQEEAVLFVHSGESSEETARAAQPIAYLSPDSCVA